MDTKQFVPAGHFYSSIPDLNDIRAKQSLLFNKNKRDIPGVNLREDYQIKLISEKFIQYYAEQPWDNKISSLRYCSENSMYGYSDAIFLYCMLRNVRPARLIEVGSGYSSCVVLDTNDIFFDGNLECTFIEPHPDTLKGLLYADDFEKINIIQNKLQDVDVSLFSNLKENDILLIDSTHVSKIGSDVNYLFFEILPKLSPGVFVHFHDIFYPFEYPAEWIFEGRQWQEDYLLRAFLQFNNMFEIVVWNDFLMQFNKSLIAEKMPICLNGGGASLWIRHI